MIFASGPNGKVTANAVLSLIFAKNKTCLLYFFNVQSKMYNIRRTQNAQLKPNKMQRD